MLEYYGLAFFIFALIALLMLIYRYFFNLTREQKLDEKEEKMLKLYSSLEEIMDNFRDYVESTSIDIAGETNRILEMTEELRKTQDELASKQKEHTVAATGKKQPGRAKGSKLPTDGTPAVAPSAAILSQITSVQSQSVAMSEMGEEPFVLTISDEAYTRARAVEVERTAVAANPLPTPEARPKSKKERIREMYSNGKSPVEIAQELGIARSEVELVIELQK